MAIGDTNSNNTDGNRSNRLYENSYYNRLRIRKDNTALSFEFRSGLLQVKIVSVNPDGFSFDMEHPKAVIYLSPTKATMLANQIRVFKNYLENEKIHEERAFGVNGGMGEKVSFIAFSANKDKEIFVTIGKFDGNGKIIESTQTGLNKDYHYALEWTDLNAMDVTRVFNNYIELDQLMHLFDDFGRYMNGAAAYAQADLTRYDNARILNKMNPIYEKLGIERLSGNNGGRNYQSNNNFLNNTGKSESKSYDDIQDMFGD